MLQVHLCPSRKYANLPIRTSSVGAVDNGDNTPAVLAVVLTGANVSASFDISEVQVIIKLKTHIFRTSQITQSPL